MRYVSVKFKTNPTLFTFKTDLDLKVGDFVVVDTRYGYNIASVVNFEKEYKGKVIKWVVQKVDVDNHLIRLTKEESRRKNRRLKC